MQRERELCAVLLRVVGVASTESPAPLGARVCTRQRGVFTVATRALAPIVEVTVDAFALGRPVAGCEGQPRRLDGQQTLTLERPCSVAAADGCDDFDAAIFQLWFSVRHGWFLVLFIRWRRQQPSFATGVEGRNPPLVTAVGAESVAGVGHCNLRRRENSRPASPRPSRFTFYAARMTGAIAVAAGASPRA